jgi:predicted RNA polymerase sigma factor
MSLWVSTDCSRCNWSPTLAAPPARPPTAGCCAWRSRDRSLWDRDALALAHELIVEGLRGGRPGRYLLQAAIASMYAQPATYGETDWPQIVTLYDRLLEVWPSPVVALNRAVAVAQADGSAVALLSGTPRP